MSDQSLARRKVPEPSLYGLPEDLRVRLFENYITNSTDLLSLRTVCHQFNHEINQLVGISSLISLDEFSLEEPIIRDFYSSVVLRHVRYDYIFQTNLKDLTLQPSKLESILIDGSIRSEFIQQILDLCPNLVTFQVKADITSSILETSSKTRLKHLKKLDIATGYTNPIPRSLKKTFCRDRTTNSMALLSSILAPKLTSLEFHLILTVSFDLLDLANTLFEFIFIHQNIENVDICIKFDNLVAEQNQEENAEMNQLQIQSISHNNNNMDEQRRKKLDKFFQSMKKKSQKKSSSMETIKIIWSFQEESNIWIKYLETFTSLKNLGIKLPGPNLWSQFSPIIYTNSQTLTNIYIQCTFKSSVNFGDFGGCPNLKSISLHNQKYPSRPMIRLINIPSGLEFLPSLKVVIIDGLVVSGPEMEVLSAWNLKVIGLCGVVAVDYFADDLILPIDHIGQGDAAGEITGVTYQSFMNLILNRNLDGLLVEMDSISVTSIEDGMEILEARDAINGKFQSLFLDISDWEGPGSSEYLVPYWRTSFLGFTVQFPFIPSCSL